MGGQERFYTLVRIETQDGLVGWGEARCHSPRGEAALAVQTLIERGFAPLLKGVEPLDITAVMSELDSAARWFRQGLVDLAFSAIEIALQDLKGKVLGVPVYVLLGGKIRDKVRACASTHFDMEDLTKNVDHALSYTRDRYGSVKFGWGSSPTKTFGLDLRRDIEAVTMLRDALGPLTDIMIDVTAFHLHRLNADWTVAHATHMARELERLGILWLEEPLLPNDYAGYTRLRQHTSMLIAGGEWEYNLDGIGRLLENRSVDIIQPDVARIGGISVSKEAADMASRQNIRYSPHTWSTAINTAASLQVLAAAKNGLLCELVPRPSPLNEELVVKPIKQEDGHIEIPSRPGLGIEVSEEFVKSHTFSAH